MMRSTRASAVAAARKSDASCTPCERQFWCSHGVCEACGLRAVLAAPLCVYLYVRLFGPRAVV
eukprot:1274240-Lingulodinium_polyedra.AAC.1